MRFFSGCFVSFLLVGSAAFSDVSDGLTKLDSGDLSGAAEAFAAAYDAGDGEGAFYLGRLFELGLGTDKDEARAANLYSAAVEKGSPKAKLRLGLIYHEGRVLLRDYAQGTKLICEAADAGEADGQLNCGLAYQQGIGVSVDEDKARGYFEAAVAQENIAAMNVLSNLYLNTGDIEKGKEFALLAADKGNALGMFRYAEIISQGDAPDLVNAYAYANLAFVRGFSQAGALRDRLEEQMSLEEISAGQEQAKAWTNAQIQKLAQ